MRPRKRHQEVLEVLKKVRRRYPQEQRIHLILDNFSPHRKAKVVEWCDNNNVHLVWTPTNASWLNPIECQFTHVKEFVIRNTDYEDFAKMADALRQYTNYCNGKARKKLKDLS